jgi:hypothetical protein
MSTLVAETLIERFGAPGGISIFGFRANNRQPEVAVSAIENDPSHNLKASCEK